MAKDILSMSAEELAERARRYESGDVPLGEPMTPAERERWDRAGVGGSASVHLHADGSVTANVERPGPGRPKVGEGSEVTAASIERGLLRRAMAKAKALGLKRSEYFTKALELLTDGGAEVGQLRFVASLVPGEGGGELPPAKLASGSEPGSSGAFVRAGAAPSPRPRA